MCISQRGAKSLRCKCPCLPDFARACLVDHAIPIAGTYIEVVSRRCVVRRVYGSRTLPINARFFLKIVNKLKLILGFVTNIVDKVKLMLGFVPNITDKLQLTFVIVPNSVNKLQLTFVIFPNIVNKLQLTFAVVVIVIFTWFVLLVRTKFCPRL